MQKKTTLTVEGMHCAHCEAKVNDGLCVLAGVTSVKANSTKGTVRIAHDDTLDLDRAAQVIAEAGFKVIA